MGTIYKRLVNVMFVEYIGSSMDVYIDDKLMKKLQEEKHIDHLC